MLFGDDLAHSLIETLEVVGRERSAISKFEVVIEAILNGRTDRKRGPREQVEDRLGQHVGSRVANGEQTTLVGLGDDRNLVAGFEWPHEISLSAVDCTDNGRLREA